MQSSPRRFLGATVWPAIGLLVLIFLSGALPAARAQAPGPLTAQEREWLSAHPEIAIAPDPSYPPVEYFDARGDYRGMAADLVALVEQVLSVRFRIVHLQNWDEIIEKAKQRQIDMFGAAAETPQRSGYMQFTSPFFEFRSVIIVRDSVVQSLTPEKLNGMKVAVVSGYADHDYLVNHYPLLDLVAVPSVETGLRKVSFGMADALVANLAAATYFIEQEGITNLRVAGDTGYVYRLAFGVRSDWPELVGILEKGLAQIGSEKKAAIVRKWVAFDEEHLYRKKEFWLSVSLGAAGLFLVLIGLLVWNRSLKSLVNQRTRELNEELTVRARAEEALRQARDELEDRVEERTAELHAANVALRSEIQERERVDRALRAAHHQLQDVIEFLPDPTFVVDREKKVIAWNRAIEELTGAGKAEVLGLGGYAYALPLYGERRPLLIDLVMTGETDAANYDYVEIKGSTVCGEVFIPGVRGGQGAYVVSTASPLFDKDKAVIGAIQTIRDVTGRKLAEKALRESEERFRAIFVSAQECIFLKDHSFRYILVNPAMEKLFGLSGSELTGITGRDLFGEETGGSTDKEDSQVLAGEVVNAELVRTIAGRKTIFDITKVPIRDQSGNIMGLCGIARDITERRRAEEALKESEERLRLLSARLLNAQEEERKRIARDVHDSIGSVLTGIKIHLETAHKQMLKGKTNPEAFGGLVSITQQAIRDCRRIITELRPTILDDYGVIVTIGWLCEQYEVLHGGIAFERRIDCNEADISADLKIVIFRVLQEALNNICIHSGAERAEIMLAKESGRIRLRIGDNGRGFVPNAMLAGARKGFGLANMKERIELSGGLFELESRLGEGTVIRASWSSAEAAPS
jgi:PAS domain S-box-containing protein